MFPYRKFVFFFEEGAVVFGFINEFDLKFDTDPCVKFAVAGVFSVVFPRLEVGFVPGLL